MEQIKLPELPYAYNALEPYYDAQTIEIHHSKHHAGYVSGLNNAFQQLQQARESRDYTLVKHWEREFAFHGSGHKLHTLFWKNMRPGDENNKAKGILLTQIENNFESWDKFVEQFKAATVSVEGSGWGVLAKCHHGKLHILALENHQNHLVPGMIPLLVCDVWEHAYYLKYQNRRAEWVDNFMKLIDWNEVTRRFKE